MSPIHHIGRSKKRMGANMRFVTFRIKCVLWVERDNSGPFEGFGFASDVSETGTEMFINLKLAKGTAVRIALEDDTETPYHGVVSWCRRYSLDQRFHGQASLDYRVGIQLFFESETARQRYLMYYNDLRKRAAAVPNQFKF